jgi:hypothetical protein
MLHLEEHPVVIGDVVMQAVHPVSVFEHAREIVTGILGKIFALLFVTAFTGLEIVLIIGLLLLALRGLDIENLYSLVGWSAVQADMPALNEAFDK